jgi:hypothetical protein
VKQAAIDRLQAAADFVAAELRNGAQPMGIIGGLMRDHGASYSTASSTNTLRCAGVAGTCTWSAETGLVDSWRRNAIARLAREWLDA